LLIKEREEYADPAWSPVSTDRSNGPHSIKSRRANHLGTHMLRASACNSSDQEPVGHAGPSSQSSITY
jgi:hypothetical protein